MRPALHLHPGALRHIFTGVLTTMSHERYHEPVLLSETLRALEPAPGKIILDGTLGGGGHTEALFAAGARVIGLDQDPQALAFAKNRCAGAGDRLITAHANFSDAAAVLDRLGIDFIDGALLDLGVSSWQLDTPERGFSFQHDGPLDMRMNPGAPLTAADLVNNATGEQLERIFHKFGEERAARRVAARLVRERLKKPFVTTLDLAQAVEAVIPRRGRAHPATRVFQALRIAVNRELESLEEGLEVLTARLRPSGRLAVITFHSLEDRIVKTFLKTRSAETIDRPEWPAARPNPDRKYRLLSNKSISPTPAEQERNPRSRSARLRIAERISN